MFSILSFSGRAASGFMLLPRALVLTCVAAAAAALLPQVLSLYFKLDKESRDLEQLHELFREVMTRLIAKDREVGLGVSTATAVEKETRETKSGDPRRQDGPGFAECVMRVRAQNMLKHKIPFPVRLCSQLRRSRTL